MKLGVEYDDNWYSVGNINYDALDDQPNDPPYFYADLYLEQLKAEAMVVAPIDHLQNFYL